ncbi:Hsp70 family protein [Butyrivibrio sp. YAB3001]|uniref:Hsp70 family protein n=1 Tax=Butyrivibrio sp. YAB3001 TaxID=1520812 RepID=UPI0008F67CDF|nr:Hsp70 family protein [Butyrivibrio sp. YAB3001]SFC66692.1 Hsp70 protein [Butyrivibrio sp. YAB3001]
MANGIEKIQIPFISGRYSLNEELTLEDLQRISAPIIEKAMQPIRKALEKADLSKEDIDLVILAGGSSQLPGVYSRIYEELGVEPRKIPKDLMLAIAYGACLYQKEIKNFPKTKRDVRTLGSSLGIYVDDGGKKGVKLLLNHNKSLPAMEKYEFDVSEGQTTVSLNLVTLVGNSDRVEKQLKQRNLSLSGDASKVVVEITVTENRLIELNAYDPAHPEKKAIIQLDSQMMTKEDIERKRSELGIEVVSSVNKLNQEPCIGIDLGTTTSELTYTYRSEDQLDKLANPDVPSQYDKYCFPSVIYFNDRYDNPEIANTKACNALGDASSKDKLCREFKVADRNKYVVEVDGHGFKVGDLSALLLHKIWDIAKLTFPNMNLRSAVITVPAAFDFDACQETFNAARTAGIETVTLIDEPTAAYQYYSHVQDLSDSNIRNVLIFDFGGGTTDVAILDVKNDALHESNEYKDCLYSVLGVSGEVNCGGKNIDDALVAEIKKRFEEKNNCVLSPTGEMRLRNEVISAKVKLSEYYSEIGDE